MRITLELYQPALHLFSNKLDKAFTNVVKLVTLICLRLKLMFHVTHLDFKNSLRAGCRGKKMGLGQVGQDPPFICHTDWQTDRHWTCWWLGEFKAWEKVGIFSTTLHCWLDSYKEEGELGMGKAGNEQTQRKKDIFRVWYKLTRFSGPGLQSERVLWTWSVVADCLWYKTNKAKLLNYCKSTQQKGLD